MTNPISAKQKSVLAALAKHPEYLSDVKELRGDQNGLLIFFFPPVETEGEKTAWESTVSQLAKAHPVLKASGIGAVGVVPPITDLDYFKKNSIPFPLVQFENEGKLAANLWKAVRSNEKSSHRRVAFLLTPDPANAMKWPDYNPDALDQLVLDHLLEKQLLMHKPDQHGFLLFFHPGETPKKKQSKDKSAPDWLPAVLDLAAAYPLLDDQKIAVAGVVPALSEEDFFEKFNIPFPLAQFDEGDAVPAALWRLAHGQSKSEAMKPFSRFAVLQTTRSSDQERQGLVLREEFPDYRPDSLERDILALLEKKNLVVFSQDSSYVRFVEQLHLSDRRKKAVEEGEETLNRVQNAGANQVRAYRTLMSGGGHHRRAIGLAFSGGGIRAATFNLGILQALGKLRLLPWVDYVSSVSGGGFTAAALVSLLSRRTTSRRYFFNTQWEQFPFNPEIEAFKPDIDLDGDPDRREDRNFRDVSYKKGHNTQLSYMLKHGNYLIPRLGLATRDLLRGVGSLLPGILFTVFLFVVAMFGLASLHYFTANLITPVVLQDIDTTRLAPAAEPDRNSVTLEIGLDGQTATVELPLKADQAAGQPGAGQDPFTLYGLLFGRYTSTPPILGRDSVNEGRNAAQFPWWIYMTVFLAGAVTPYFAYRFLAATYSYPRTRKKTQKTPAQFARRPGEKKDVFYPRPRRLLATLWPALILSIAALVLTLFQPGIDGPGVLVYPAAILIAGFLIVQLLRGVPKNGTVPLNRGNIWLYAVFLLVFGAELAFPWIGQLLNLKPDANLVWIWPLLAIVIFSVLVSGIQRTDVDSNRWGRHGFDRWEWYDPFALRAISGFHFGILLITLAVVQAVFAGRLITEVLWIWQPAVFFAGSLAFLTLFRLLIPGENITWGSARFRTVIWALIGINVYAVLGALLFALLILPHIFAVGGADATSPAVPLGTAILSGLWAAFLAQFSGKETTGESSLKKLLALPGSIRNFVLGLLVVVLWVSMIFLFESWLDRFISNPIQALGMALVSAALFIVFGALQNYNHLSPHYFYGDRIADVFLKTRVEQADGRVATVRDYSTNDLKEISHAESSAPYHLVVTAVNLAGSGHQQDRDRKSRHFLFTKKFIGSDVTGYALSDVYRGGKTKYGSTIALSGAAASPGLGTFTFFAQAFMMTLLNIRLGEWWVNPKEYRRISGTSETYTRLSEFENRAFWPLYLMDEALAKTSERRRLVNITDGGHTRDNGGLYPLFERRCKVIIAGDASHDPEGVCHDLFSVLHYVRVDLDIKVDIDISRLQPAAESKNGKIQGMSDMHCAIGRIEYPPIYRADGSVKHPAETGWLIYFKPAISKRMPAEVLQFWQTNKEMFPHPSTADQFFSERQFESQRRLGEESVLQSLEILLEAYGQPKTRLQDKNKVKSSFLLHALKSDALDFDLLKKQPALLDEIMQDWMETLSPAGNGGA